MSASCRKQVERLSAILDGAPFPVWLTDEQRNVVWVNRAYLDAVEMEDVEAVVGRRIMLVNQGEVEFEETADAEKTVRRGRSHAVIAGAKRALEVYESALAEGFASFAVDVTALEDSQKELKRHIRAHASTLDKLDTAIAIFGPDQTLRFFNSAYVELWELDPAWLGTNPTEGEILDRLREAAQAARTGQLSRLEEPPAQRLHDSRDARELVASARRPVAARRLRAASVRRRHLSLRERDRGEPGSRASTTS